jgi:hypothetical protein
MGVWTYIFLRRYIQPLLWGASSDVGNALRDALPEQVGRQIPMGIIFDLKVDEKLLSEKI